jgi:hypothetical protein
MLVGNWVAATKKGEAICGVTVIQGGGLGDLALGYCLAAPVGAPEVACSPMLVGELGGSDVEGGRHLTADRDLRSQPCWNMYVIIPGQFPPRLRQVSGEVRPLSERSEPR